MARETAPQLPPNYAVTGTPTGKFPKTAHLLKRADFQRVYQQGRRHFSGNMTVFYLSSPTTAAVEEKMASPSCVRVGFTVPRALGKAVDRNRIRRRLREAVRHHLGELGGIKGLDVVFNPKRSALKAEFTALDKEVERAFGVIRKYPQPASKKAEEGSR